MEPQFEATLTIGELSELIRIPKSTLYRWRSRGKGPRAMKMGRHLRYRASDVAAWQAHLAAADHHCDWEMALLAGVPVQSMTVGVA